MLYPNIPPMVETYGLTHIALKVSNLERSRIFYERLFGTRVMYKDEDFIQIQTAGTRDIIVLEKSNEVLHNENGILHFGFRLKNPMNIETLVQEVSIAGGKIKEKGEFVPGEPYVFLLDPDGYEIEIWYEKIPPELSGFD